ncbi:MAG: hypothetical protein ACJAS9_000931 [Polaribacter sp.]|jgi:hypothetical protein
MEFSNQNVEVIRAIFFAGLPTAVITFLMVFFAIKRGYVELGEDLDELKKRKKQAKISKTEFKVNLVHSKWLYFGGGYYGLMALTTYAHVEFMEIYDFFGNFSSIANFIDKISFGAFIRLIIDSFMNLIPAFTWFLYWPKIIVMHSGWYWLGASYVGYHIGSYLGNWFMTRENTSN